MKVAVSAGAPSLDAGVDERFGRCACFVVVDPETMAFEPLPNDSAARGSGAGIQAARLLVDQGVVAVLTGNCGPKAWQALSGAGIRVVVGCSGTVREAVERYAAGQLSPAAGPNVQAHAGQTLPS